MGLFHITIFMSDAHIVFRRLHAIMSHQRLIALRPVFGVLLARILDRSRHMIGAMLRRHATDLPERFLKTLCQGFKRFTETDGNRLHIGVREHKMMDHMGEGYVGNRDTQILHMRKIRLSSFTRDVLLCKHHLAIWSMQHTPLLNMTL